MKVMSFKSTSKDENGKLIFDGTYKIEMPKFTERLKIVQELQAIQSADVDGKDETNALDVACKMGEMAEKYICGLSLKHVGSGEEFNSFEDLEYCEEVALISAEVFGHLTKGKTLGKTSKPRSRSK